MSTNMNPLQWGFLLSVGLLPGLGRGAAGLAGLVRLAPVQHVLLVLALPAWVAGLVHGLDLQVDGPAHAEELGGDLAVLEHLVTHSGLGSDPGQVRVLPLVCKDHDPVTLGGDNVVVFDRELHELREAHGEEVPVVVDVRWIRVMSGSTATAGLSSSTLKTCETSFLSLTWMFCMLVMILIGGTSFWGPTSQKPSSKVVISVVFPFFLTFSLLMNLPV